MRERFHLDVYNVIIVALIPAILLTAWGLTSAHDRNERSKRCENAIDYLEAVTDLAPLYTSARTIDDADEWLDAMEELPAPDVAQQLHTRATAAFSYASAMGMDVSADEPGDLFDQLTAFRDGLDESRTELEEQCPNTADLIPDAFPMYFREEQQ